MLEREIWQRKQHQSNAIGNVIAPKTSLIIVSKELQKDLLCTTTVFLVLLRNLSSFCLVMQLLFTLCGRTLSQFPFYQITVLSYTGRESQMCNDDTIQPTTFGQCSKYLLPLHDKNLGRNSIKYYDPFSYKNHLKSKHD